MLLANLQENLLTLLCYDNERAPIIRNVVNPNLYGGPYRILAARIYDYIDSFKKPPGDHLPDIMADKLDGEAREGELYADIIENIHATRKGINAEYVMSTLETFIKRQSLRSIAIDLAKALQRDTDESLEEAETLIAGATRQSLQLFDPGTRLSDKKRALQFLDISADNSFSTGIRELDRRGLGPTRKELWLFIGNAKAGKSWMLGQLARMAAMHRMKVCHVTLEMSEARVSQRYFQNFFAMAKRKDKLTITKFQRDSLGRITGFDTNEITPVLSLEDPNIRKKLERRISRYSTRLLDNIIVRQFPTSELTVPQLKAYLDNLESSERFVPDLLIVDYPQLMKLDPANIRLELDQTIKQIRGIAVARNIAIAIVSQSHRSAADAKLVKASNVAEAYSQIAHADVTVTYSQTASERTLGLARLFVAAGRNDEDKFTIVISQSYASGQFVMDSNMLKGTYWENLPKGDENE